jgi:hypothetical protein
MTASRHRGTVHLRSSSFLFIHGLYEKNHPSLFPAIQAMILSADGKFAELV